MLNTVVAPTMTRREARAALVAAGWDWVGGGSFAAVYGSPDGTRVAKITKPDGGAEATYEVSKAHEGNPHLPRYFDRIALANGGYAYEVERLEPVDPEDFDYELEYDTGDGQFDDALDALLGTGLGDDSHWRNIMRRDTGEIVLTDVLFDRDDLNHTATISAGQADAGDFDDAYRPGSMHFPADVYGQGEDLADLIEPQLPLAA